MTSTTAYPKLKLSYFGIKGRAEVIRLTLHIAGIPFEDARINGEAWKQLKPQTPFGQMPTLTVNDTTIISQSAGILRYAGTLAGLYPSTDALKATFVDQILFHLEDINVVVAATYKNETDVCKKIAEDKLPAMLADLEKVVEEHGKGPFAVGDHLTVADVSIYDVIGFLQSGDLRGIPTTIADGYERISQICAHVGQIPKVVEWEAAH
ncbi:hypothetical protein BATDEDRAFT_84750 [Batrachochytrium dendrobatidis JAM81]|uniref:Glutathione S-transferase n=2 Tax=Batrachochytrium dendrobatidis TaxID=109871 RepID=F4NUP1_BATDJ|nr:uncharacterized protein BATDEDRAFT_84750 [Batrachochytrium dendrobatidis JAM81]EGF83206.1 hypothetical protein BATDEDRAFT_84750 [Batrachochytrium dendrobatidis JAM81]KAJ8325678.1 hypothetical protein O5D80_005878 [Batrachochytrium dendrobatidis]KAK5671343.1 hypothetical protein QVD99_002063 [Batrachochytrium dendrobatidis]OAJ36449.1 hypothetical protein BDEG_20620 [Batrachochytrium dendrobatidis JEL423]|eukprot:XP_006676017.1 hypothetical protein BATDEDRAFT_84750 [Batrachochytrium dendrobatidis JAM81]